MALALGYWCTYSASCHFFQTYYRSVLLSVIHSSVSRQSRMYLICLIWAGRQLQWRTLENQQSHIYVVN